MTFLLKYKMLLNELLKLYEAEVVAPDEDPKKRQVKTKTKSDINLGPKVHHQVASKADTDKAVRNIKPTGKAMTHLSDLHKNLPSVGGEEGVEEPKHEPTTLPKVIMTDLKSAGFVDPKFHIVSNLPGNMSAAIRQLGKALFAAFTRTPVDKISMIGNLGGHGPNTKEEVNAVAAFCRKVGNDLGPGSIDFDKIMPGYEAKIHHYLAGGVHYMLVRDDMGDYVYAWPAENTIGDMKQKQDRLK